MIMNPYQVLGVDAKAKQDEIKTAYRNLAKKFHPDLNPGNKKAEIHFKEINTAYSLIGTQEEREKYDRGELESQAAKKHSQQRNRPFYRETQYGGGRYTDAFGGMDEDVLHSIFEQMRQSETGGRRGAVPGILYQLEIDFKDSVLGGEQKIVFPNGKTILVKIPAGVESGAKLRLPGKEDQSGLAEDIYVQIHVKASPVFKRNGKDLEVEVPVSFSDAVLGGEIKVPTIDGSVLMKIPANISTDQKLRLKGKGVVDSTNNSRGDQIVILKVKMIEKVDEDFIKAVQDWKKRQAKGSL